MAELPSTPADGKVRVAWAPAIADTTAPTATELADATIVDLSCYLTGDGFNPSLDEATVSDPRLCDVQTYERRGRVTRGLSLTYIENPGDVDTNEAYDTLVPGTTGYIVVRRGPDFDTAFAAADVVDVWPVEAGERSKLAPEANSVLRVTQRMFVTGGVQTDVAVATAA